MLLTETVKMKINNFNDEFYRNKGYICKYGDIIDIKVNDASKSSKAKIELLCDECKEQIKITTIESYNSSYKNGNYVCKDCYKEYLNNRKCDICFSTDGVSNYLNQGVLLCKKHQKQMWRHGATTRTINDPNEIRIFNDYIEFDTYDKKGVATGTFKADIDMIDFIKTHKMHKHKDGYACYKFIDKCGEFKNMRFHRYVMGVAENSDSLLVVDHINRDKSDNRKANLRLVSQKTNNRNTDNYSHNTSGYKGISYNHNRQKWEVYIHQNNKKINLGLYNTIEKAIQVRELSEIIYFGSDSPRYEELIQKYINNKEAQEYLLHNMREMN